jgi:hypothetical protein
MVLCAARLCLSVSCVMFITSTVTFSSDSSIDSSDVRGVSIGGRVLTEDSCELLLSAGGEKPELREAPGLHVLDRTSSRPLTIISSSQTKISGVVCWRSEATLAPNDYLVAMSTGLALYIKTDIGSQAVDRTIVLERINGMFGVRLLSGPPWSSTEERENGDAIKRFDQKAAHGS